MADNEPFRGFTILSQPNFEGCTLYVQECGKTHLNYDPAQNVWIEYPEPCPVKDD